MHVIRVFIYLLAIFLFFSNIFKVPTYHAFKQFSYENNQNLWLNFTTLKTTRSNFRGRHWDIYIFSIRSF